MDDAESHYQHLLKEITLPNGSMNSRPGCSILKEGSLKQSVNTRRDSYGEEIIPHGRHRIKFKKEVY
jgi:hypothetical protein